MAWIAPVIGAVSALYGAYKSNKANQQQGDYMKQQQALLNQTKPYADYYSKMGQQAFMPVMNYYQSLMSGNRAAMTGAMAPELNAINSQYLGAYNQMRNMYPRGGMTTAQASNLPFQQQGRINNTLFGVRQGAAANMGNLAGTFANLGMQGYGMASGMQNNLFGNMLRGQQQQMDAGAGIGNSLWNAYQGYMLQRNVPDSSPAAGEQLPMGSSYLSGANLTPSNYMSPSSNNGWLDAYNLSPATANSGTTTNNMYSGAAGTNPNAKAGK